MLPSSVCLFVRVFFVVTFFTLRFVIVLLLLIKLSESVCFFVQFLVEIKEGREIGKNYSLMADAMLVIPDSRVVRGKCRWVKSGGNPATPNNTMSTLTY